MLVGYPTHPTITHGSCPSSISRESSSVVRGRPSLHGRLHTLRAGSECFKGRQNSDGRENRAVLFFERRRGKEWVKRGRERWMGGLFESNPTVSFPFFFLFFFYL